MFALMKVTPYDVVKSEDECFWKSFPVESISSVEEYEEENGILRSKILFRKDSDISYEYFSVLSIHEVVEMLNDLERQ